VHHAEPVRRWLADGAGVRVETIHGTYTAEQVVVTAGPWTVEVLAELALPLTNWRMVPVRFDPTRPEFFQVGHCPIYVWAVPEGVYGGLPSLPGEGLKISRHDSGEVCTMLRLVSAAKSTGSRLRRRWPCWTATCPVRPAPSRGASTCLYTNTPDGHFIVDRHPVHAQVLYACGFCEHGFKFATVMGEVLADLALDGATRHPIGFLPAARFATPAAGLT
jgi:sarcosine oxidase